MDEPKNTIEVKSPAPGKSVALLVLRVFTALFVVVTVASYVAAYVLHSESFVSKELAAYVPTSFGFVGVHPLWLNTYNEEVAGFKHFYAQQAGSVPSDEDVHQIVLSHMKREVAAATIAHQYGVVVTQADVDAAYHSLATEATSSAHLSQAVLQLWGWNQSSFERYVLRPYVLETKLAEALRKDPVLGREVGNSSDLQPLHSYLDNVANQRTFLWLDPTKLHE